MTSLASSARSRPHPLASDPEWTHQRFERAVEIIQTLPKGGPINTNYDEKLALYSTFKQATEGDIKTGRPGLLDVLGRAKWDAWNKRKGLNQMEAERLYVEALIKILKGYSDRTQAVELLRELETFSIDLRGRAGHGSVAPSRTGSSHSSDSDSTASYDARRSMPPPPLPASASRHLHPQQHPTRSSRTLAPPPAASSTGGRYRTPAPASPRGAPVPAPADVVAPPLPGYGPPRTQPDAVRRPSRRRRRQSQRSYSSSGSETGSETGSSDENDTRQYHPAPSQRSYAAAARPAQIRRGPPSLPPHPSHLSSALSAPPSAYLARPQSLHQVASSLRSVAGSEAPPSITGGRGQAQQVAVAYPPGFVPQRVIPLTAGNLLRTATTTVPQTPLALSGIATPLSGGATIQAPAPPAPPALDAALERIQTSLTALHERLALLEDTPATTPPLQLASTSSPVAALRDLLLRIFLLLRLRRAATNRAPGSPSLSRSAPVSPPTNSGVFTLSLRLVAALLRSARRVVADAVVVFAVVCMLGRLRGVDVPREVGGWVVRYAIGTRGGAERARLT